MNFFRVLSILFACFMALSTVSASPTPDFWKDLEKVGQNIRDGIIKAGPAVDVIGQVSDIYHGKDRDSSERE